jgi:hypothetical protein
MTMITAVVLGKMTMVTVAHSDNCGGVGGIEDDDGDSGRRQQRW